MLGFFTLFKNRDKVSDDRGFECFDPFQVSKFFTFLPYGFRPNARKLASNIELLKMARLLTQVDAKFGFFSEKGNHQGLVDAKP